MSEDNITEEELLENTMTEQPRPEAEAEGAEGELPEVYDAYQVEPIKKEELYEHALDLLRDDRERDDLKAAEINELYKKHFGENPTEEDYAADLSDKRQEAVVTDYINDYLERVKTKSTCLNQQRINKAFENIFSLLHFKIVITPNADEYRYDAIFEKSAKLNPLLLKSYKVLKLNRQVCHIYSEKMDVTELSKLVNKMEDLDSKIKTPGIKVVNNELLAQFYYNVSEVYESSANRKGSLSGLNTEHSLAIEYKKRALEKTKRNITMVANIQNVWKDYHDYDHEKITEACKRIIYNRHTSDRDKYRAHKLWADTKLGLQVIDGFVGKEKRIDEVVEHYEAALVYATNDEDIRSILESEAKAQKNVYPDDYIATRCKIANMLEGRERIQECNEIADFVSNKKLKIDILQTCIDEFHELPVIEIEDRLLYDSIDKKMRSLLPDRSRKKIKELNEMKSKYGTQNNQSRSLLFPIMSSKGHDYFSK